MTVSQWPSNVNTRFYSGNDKPLENTEEVSFLSGRRVAWQINTKKLMSFKLKLQLTHTELANFWTWFNDTLGQTAGCFTCSAIGNGYYKFMNIPSPDDTDQTTRVLSMEIQEVL